MTVDAWANPYDNTTTNGWYAVNKGRLLLCSRTIPSGSVTTNWAEDPTDTEIDLVNSLRFSFNTTTNSGTLNVKLLATDRSDVPAPPAQKRLIGAWDCTFSANFASLGMECRYDHVAADGKSVALYRWNPGNSAWDSLGGTPLSGYRVAAMGIAPLASGMARIGLVVAAVSVAPQGTAFMFR